MASRRGERRKMKNERKSQLFKKDDVLLTKIQKLSISNFPLRTIPIVNECESATEAAKGIWEAIDNSLLMNEPIRQYFCSFPNNYWNLLKLLKANHNHCYKSSSNVEKNLYANVAQQIVNEFKNLELEIADSCPCEEVQMASFHLLSDLNAGYLFEDANSLFHYDSQPQLCVNLIAHLVHKSKYKLAGQWVILLDLQSHFKLTDILLPLLIEDEIELMEDYLVGESQSNRMSFLKLCNYICKEKETLEQIKLKLGIKNAKITEQRQLARAIQRLPGQYNIPLVGLLHLTGWFNVFIVDHLVTSQYRYGLYEDEDWEYFLTEVAGGNVGFQMEALRMIAIHMRDMGRAIQLAKKWRTPKLKIDPKIMIAMQSRQEFPITRFPRRDCEDNYYAPKLPNIFWISKTLEYEECIKFLTKIKMVGLKSEYKRNFHMNHTGLVTKSSILQISTPDRIYLLDLLALKSILTVKEWRKLVVKVFANSSIGKLVFDFDDEWTRLSNMCPLAFKNATYKTKCFIDLKCVVTTITDDKFSIFARKKQRRLETGDFDDLLQCCFNSSLNRREEISNWEKRPLRETQQQYAAIGAFGLLEIYKYLEQECCKEEIDFEELIQFSQVKLCQLKEV